MLQDRLASQVALYTLPPGARIGSDSWLDGVECQASPGPEGPRIVCRLPEGTGLRYSVRIEGRAWFSAGVIVEGETSPSLVPLTVSISVLGKHGSGAQSSARLAVPVPAPGQSAGNHWRLPLGRFRGELVDIVLTQAGGAPGGDASLALENPLLHIDAGPWRILIRGSSRLWRTLWAEGVQGVVADLAALADASWAQRLRYRFWVAEERRRRARERNRPNPDGIAAHRTADTTFLVRVGADVSVADVGRLLDSLSRQRVGVWEAFLVVDGAARADVYALLRRRAREYARIQVLEASDGVEALNQGLAAAGGTYTSVLTPEGELAPDALAEVAAALNRLGPADVVYSDEDQLDSQGRRRDPFFKPDWSPDYFLAFPYLGQFCVFRTALARRVGGFRAGAVSAHDYDLLLRLTASAEVIHHLPLILWHRRSATDTVALPSPRDEVSHRAVVRHHLQECGVEAEVGAGLVAGTQRIRWPLAGRPLVSVVIPTRDHAHLLRRCLLGLRERTIYQHIEVLIVDNGSVEAATREFLETCGARVVRDDARFNFSRLCNLGARLTQGRHLLFLNNDTEPLAADWLTAMIELSQLPSVGAVGAKLYHLDGRLQHVGIVVGINGTAAQVFRGTAPDHPGYHCRSVTIHECSAVTGACLMTRRDVFEEVGGFDEAFPVNFNDVDYCLRVRERGYRVLFTPYAPLVHHEFATRPRETQPPEADLFRSRWGHMRDPYYNPNLSLRHTDCSVRLGRAVLRAGSHQT